MLLPPKCQPPQWEQQGQEREETIFSMIGQWGWSRVIEYMTQTMEAQPEPMGETGQLSISLRLGYYHRNWFQKSFILPPSFITKQCFQPWGRDRKWAHLECPVIDKETKCYCFFPTKLFLWLNHNTNFSCSMIDGWQKINKLALVLHRKIINWPPPTFLIPCIAPSLKSFDAATHWNYCPKIHLYFQLLSAESSHNRLKL